MLIGNKYKVESDNINVTLYEKAKSKKTGVTTWRAIAFFSNPKSALDFLVDMKVKEAGLEDFRTVVEKQEELYRLINTLKGLPERVESRRGVAK